MRFNIVRKKHKMIAIECIFTMVNSERVRMLMHLVLLVKLNFIDHSINGHEYRMAIFGVHQLVKPF